jgi:hypothetical protein
VQFWTDCSLIGKVDELGCARLNHSRVLDRPQLWLMPMQPNAMADTTPSPETAVLCRARRAEELRPEIARVSARWMLWQMATFTRDRSNSPPANAHPS